jgi:hypothetical protein
MDEANERQGRRPGMGELESYGIDKATLQQMYDEWLAGAKKGALEERYLGRTSSHGKLFTSLVRAHLGHETERRSRLAAENARLRGLLQRHGIDPDDGRGEASS